MNVCVFCSSSEFVHNSYFEEARGLGRLIAANGFNLVFGGTNIGLMGALAQAAKQHGANVSGVIPKFIYDRGIAFAPADAMIVTADMRERKATMEQMADAFIALPGGFGTLEEVLEIITLKQLRLHQKPVVIINTNGFYDQLLVFVEQMARERFIPMRFSDLILLADSSEKAIQLIAEYKPVELKEKWSG
ncbi:MAG TPA: TIGR00730 family Rossman fold protein [Bacteroidales bacterium]|nr:TIGR00730 family Rossman fold protein [Bacteroidales bacterium]